MKFYVLTPEGRKATCDARSPKEFAMCLDTHEEVTGIAKEHFTILGIGTRKERALKESQIIRVAKEYIDQVPKFREAVDNAVKRSEFEALRNATADAAGKIKPYIDQLYKEINDVLDHSYSLAATLDEIDRATAARDEFLSLHYTCLDVIELDDLLHNLTITEARERRLV